MLEMEARGLDLLRRASSSLVVPRVIALSRIAEGALLLLEWLPQGNSPARAAAFLGRGLARLHRNIGPGHGLDHNNFIGTTPQPNRYHDNWATFFAGCRLRPLARRLEGQANWTMERERGLESLLQLLPEILPSDPAPSLLHGDLWAGNWIPLQDERAALVDPAVYYGDRESDLAMTRLFGGFPERFYQSYLSEWPLEPGAEERFPIYNLYHLMNHLLLFGAGYGAGVDRILNRYGK
jgi:protein-ribulosamine 3-kinase